MMGHRAIVKVCIQAGYVVVLGAIAIASVAFAKLGGGPGTDIPLSQQRATMASEPAIHREYRYYLVNSAADREALLHSEDGAQLGQDTYVLVIQSLEEELSAFATQAELTDLGHSAEVIDLRRR